jgi:hypothetical protein
MPYIYFIVFYLSNAKRIYLLQNNILYGQNMSAT